MEVAVRIIKPIRWSEDFLAKALVEEGIPEEHIVADLNLGAEILVSNYLSIEELSKLERLN